MTRGPADADPVDGGWRCLEDHIREEIDANVLRNRPLAAIKAAWDALRPLDKSLFQAQKLVSARYEALGDQVHRRPPDALDVSSLAARATAHSGRVAVVEALWDGDTIHDWFVVLVAVLDDPEGERRLATVYHRTGGPTPGAAATEAGLALAEHLGVPFHFASPTVPDDEAPRWRTTQHPDGS